MTTGKADETLHVAEDGPFDDAIDSKPAAIMFASP